MSTLTHMSNIPHFLIDFILRLLVVIAHPHIISGVLRALRFGNLNLFWVANRLCSKPQLD